MLAANAPNWWAIALEGLAAVIFGILALVWPGLTLLTLVMLFGAFALVDGVLSAIAGLASDRGRDWWVVLRGLAGAAIGLAVFLWPGVTALMLLYFIAGWAIVTGALHVVAGIQLRQVITNEWLVLLAGVASIVFGIVLAMFPGAGALGLVWLIGAYAIALGILFIVVAFRLRGIRAGETGAQSGM